MQAPRWNPPKTGLPFWALLLLAPFLIFVNLHASSWVIFGHGLPEDEDLVRIDGTLDLPDGVDPQDYLVVNAFDVAHPNSAGDFSIAVRASGMTVNGAVLLNDPHQSNPWVGVTTLNEPGDGGGKVVRISTKSDSQLVISPRSTAKAMIQVSPFAVTRDPQRAMLLASILEDLPELDLLEAVIADVYMEQDDFASHPEIRQAHQALVEALDRGMPDLPPPLHVDDSFTSAPVTKSGAHDKAQPLRVQFNSLDSTRQVEYRLVEHGSLAGVDMMMMEAVEFMPLDSVATMTRLDPADLYRYTDESGNSQRIRSNREALSLRNRPHRHPIFEGEQDRDGRQVAVIGAKSMFRWLNLGEVLGQVLSSGIEALLPDVTADAILEVDRNQTGIYVIRVHTGKMHDGIMDTVGEGSVVLEHHFDEVMFALTVNISMALLDVIDIIVGFRVDACNPLQAFLPALGTELARQAWSAAETNPIFVADTLTSLFSLFIPVMIDHYSDCLLQNPGTALLAFAKSVLTLEQVTRRISAVGSISDRVGALTGAPVGGVVGPLVAPMDTVIVVVGDPFTPAFSEVEYTDWEGNTVTESMSSLDAMDDPPGILTGGILTLRGWRILDDGEEPRRFVLVDGYGNEAIAEIVNSGVIGSPDQNFPLQEVELQLPKELLGQISVRVQGPSGPTRVQTPPVAEIVPRLLSASPDRVFGHPGSGSTVPNHIHLELEGYDSIRHRVHLGGDMQSFFLDGFRRGYFVPQRNWIDPGLHEVRIRWRDGAPMVGGDPPVMVRILDAPQITNITPDPVVSGGTINISGINFGSYLNFQYGQLGVVFYSEDGSPSSVSGTVRRVGDLGMEGENQNSFLVVEVPNITVEEREYEVAVTTPRGTSPSVPVTIVREADPPHQRQLRNYRFTEGIRDIQETSAQVLSWASHSPAPPGQRQWIIECVPTSCPDPPASRTSVRLETLPETSPSHSSRELVSHPPGYPGQAAIPAENCGPCDGGTSAQDPHPNWPATPDRWEDVGNQQVNDTIRLAGDIAGVYTGSHARIIATPGQSADSNGPGPVRFVGEGIILQGASHVEVELTPNELAGSQILAVRSSSDVQISINMPEGTVSGTSPLGIVIENSSRVSVTGNIRRANLGILVRNSTLVDLSSLEIYPEGAGGRGIDIDGGSMISVGSIDFFGGVGGTQDERKGLRLRGGLSDSQVVGVRFYGLAKGMEVEDVDRVRFGTMTFGSDGSAPFTGNLIGAVIEGGMRDSVFANAGFTGNDIGMEVRGGVGNMYNSLSFGSTNLGQVGAGNRLAMRIEDTGQPMSDNVFWFLNFNRNRQRHLELINLDDPGVFRAINLGASQVQAGVYPTLFEDNLVIQGCQNLEMRNLVVRGGINGVVIEDSSDIRFHGITCNDQTGTGLRAERTHGMELFDGTIRGEFSGDPANFLNRGIHLIACSDFHFARLSVEVTTVSGIEIEQAPEDSFGLSRLLGRKNLPGQTSPAVEPPRETTFSPFRRPPLVVSTYNSTNMVRVTARSGPAVYIHSGAGDMALGGMSINSGDGPALYLRDAGRNISVMTSNFTPSSQAVGEHSGILVEDCTAGDIDIGIPDEGNNITRTRGWGVEIRNSQGVRVRGNYIGTEGLGTFPQPNALGGILVENSGDIEIGGADPVDGNLISGNDGHGVVIRGLGSGNPTLIQGNFIGTTPTGTLDLPNDGFGILMEPAGAESGQGGAVVAENLISSNIEGGIHVSSLRGAEGVTNIRRNIIGRAFPFGVFGTFIGVEDNPADGILVTDSSGIVIQENRIAWHDGSGVVLAASDRCHLQDNDIFAHADHGLHIRDASSGHKMLNNEFANNGGMGVRVESFSRRNSISAGEFRDNTSGQIHLEPLANDDVPAPIVCEVYTRQLDDMMRLVFVRGQVAPFLPDGTRVELFASNDNVNANRLLNATVSWDGHFHSLVAEIEPGAPVPGVIATVTDANGNTSPFGIHNPTDPRCHDPWPDDRTTPPAFAPEEHPWAAVPVVMEEDDHLVLTTFSRTFLEEIETGLEETHVLRSPSLTRERGAPSLLAFTAINDEDLRQVYLYDLDEEDPAHVVPGDFTESWHPRLDPIGKRIALISDDEGTPSVYIVDLDTQDILRVTDDDGTESWPDWSPDGKRLVYTSEQEGTTTLHVVDLDDGAATPMVIDLDRYGQGANRPAWGIHGDLIAFEWIDEEEAPRVGWVDLRTMRTQPVPLGNESGHRDPVWVPGRGEIRFLLVTVPGVEPDTDAILAIGTLGYPRWLFSPDEESIHYRAPSVGVPVSQ